MDVFGILGGIAACFAIIGGLIKFVHLLRSARKKAVAAEHLAPAPARFCPRPEDGRTGQGSRPRTREARRPPQPATGNAPRTAVLDVSDPSWKTPYSTNSNSGATIGTCAPQRPRWRIEGTDAAAAFDAAMTSVIDFFNACSMIKLESEDLPHPHGTGPRSGRGLHQGDARQVRRSLPSPSRERPAVSCGGQEDCGPLRCAGVSAAKRTRSDCVARTVFARAHGRPFLTVYPSAVRAAATAPFAGSERAVSTLVVGPLRTVCSPLL